MGVKSNNQILGTMPWVSSFILSLMMVGLCTNEVTAQKHKIFPTAGITWRSTAISLFNSHLSNIDSTFRPYLSERNVQGFSLNIGLQYQLANSSITLEYYPNLRYDVTHVRLDAKHNHPIVKRFLIDHNINLMRQFWGKVIGIGLTVVNSGASYDYQARSSIIKTHDIEFKTYNAFVAFPLKKIFNLELKALYIPRGFPVGVTRKYMMFSIRVYYKFDFLN